MKTIKKTIRAILYLGDVFLFLVSPMFVILIIVCVIAFLDRYGQHNRLVNLLETHGQVTQVTLSDRPNPNLGYHVAFAAEDGERLYGFLNPKYYPPEVTNQLVQGVQVEIIYLPPPYSYETNVVLFEYFDAVKRYLGFADDIAGLFAFGWLVVALHPEWLYWGFAKDFGDILKYTWEKPAPWLRGGAS